MSYGFTYGNKQIANAKIMLEKGKDPNIYDDTLCCGNNCDECPFENIGDCYPDGDAKEHQYNLLLEFFKSLTNIYSEENDEF
jgi:hypothetical protein